LGGRRGRLAGLGIGDGALADGRTAGEARSFLNGHGPGDDVTFLDGVALQLTTLGDRDISLNLAKNNDGLGADLTDHEGVFPHGERSIGSDFPFDFAVNDQIIGELEGTFDFDVAAEDVFVGTH
jgi:hypothetical protein